MKFDKIIVLGAGVMGSCYGALLSPKNIVTMVDNNEVVAKINSRGITIITDTEKKFALIAKAKLEELEPNTLILLTTKAHQSKDAIQPIKNFFQDNTVILILQNGLGNEEIVRKITGDRVIVIRGIVNSGAWEISPGCFNLVLRETLLEPTALSSDIAQIFNQAGLPTRVSENFASELWQKLCLNCVLNPLTAILRVRNNQIGIPILKNLRHKIVEECIEIAKAEDVTLPNNLPETLDKAIQGYTNFSSMYQDIKNGKKTEIDFLNGRVVELGKKYNLPTPYNETLYAMIKFFEAKNETD